MPTFSVIVPTYNRADLLPRCLHSVLAQTFTDFELVVADDGSTDHTRSLAGEFSARDRRVRYVHQENRGGADARNLGVSVSTGKLLAFIDSDDEVAPTWLQRFCEALRQPETYIACCGQQLLNVDGTPRKTSLPTSQGLYISGTFAMRRQAFDAVGGYAAGLPASHHTELKYRLLPLCERNGWKISRISEPLAIRHLHGGPSIRTNYEAVYQSCLYILRKHETVLRSKPRNYANWATLCAMAAVQINQYSEARRWLVRAIRTCPSNVSNYARMGLMYVPGVRSFLFRKLPNTDI
jgi:glycosyltransferase involved in cell wall biosynthesis